MTRTYMTACRSIGRLAGALLLMAGLGLTAACGVLLSVGEGDCALGSVYVTGGPTKHTYQYTLDCGGDVNGWVNGAYDVTARRAEEKLTLSKGTVAAAWDCPRDPWIRATGDGFTCTLVPGSRSANLNVDSQTLTELVSSRPRAHPYSAFPLSDAQRHVLDAQLQNALKALPSAPARVPAPGAGSLSSAQKESDVVTLLRAELEVNLLDGPRELFDGQTAVYTVGIWNNGGRADGTVELQIGFSGVLQGLELEQTPAGFTCTGRATFVCTGSLGGTSDPVSSRGTVIRVRAHGAMRGLGSISANLDPNGRLSETSVANNNKTLPVTVK